MRVRKKPVVVEAMRFNGLNSGEVITWTGLDKDSIWEGVGCWDGRAAEGLKIVTLEGVMMAERGDWIIRGVKGEIYPCKPDIFDATYEIADDEAPIARNEKP